MALAAEPLEDDDVLAQEADSGTTSLGIQSVEIGMALLSALAGEPRPQPLARIARLGGMSRTKAHRYLASLERAGYVEREPGTNHYRLGGNSVRLGLAALAQLDFPRLGSEMLPAICRDLGETVFLTVWGQHGATIVRWEDAGHPVAVNVRVGSTMPLLRSATGQVFGAFLPDLVTRPFLDAELAALGPADRSGSRVAAAAIFAGVRGAGVSRAAGSYLSSIGALCVPVFDGTDALAGTITSLGVLGIFADAEAGPIAASLRRWSERLSSRLGAPAPARER